MATSTRASKKDQSTTLLFVLSLTRGQNTQKQTQKLHTDQINKTIILQIIIQMGIIRWGKITVKLFTHF